MLLDEFISETLTSIAEGIMKAQQNSRGQDWFAVPEGVYIRTGEEATVQLSDGAIRKRPVMEIQFDISVTKEVKKDSSVGIGIAFSKLGFSWGRKKGNNDASLNRMSFKIPMTYPADLLNQKG